MNKRFLALLLCSAFTVCTMTSCENSGAAGKISKTEYKTIEPPEDGWTMEELLSLTYLCGKQLSYPLTVEALGKDFTVDTSDVIKIENRLVTSTNYKGDYFAPCVFNEAPDGEPNFEKFKSISFCLPENADDFDFVINGFGFDNTQDEIESALGTPDVFNEIANVYYYYDKKDDGKLLKIFFTDGKPLEFIYSFGKK